MKVFKAAILLLLTGITVFSVYKIAVTELNYSREKEKNRVTADKFTTPEEGEDDCPIKVDFSGLSKQNPDIAGWLYCENTEINYPVVKAADNSYYLRKSFDGSYSIGGTIFADYRVSEDLSDPHIIIYGHNMHNKSMFSMLTEYSKGDFYREHPFIWLITPEKSYRLRVVSGFTVSPDSDIYRLRGHDELKSFSGDCVRRSDFISEKTSGEIIKVVTLSTCAAGNRGKRYVVTACAEK